MTFLNRSAMASRRIWRPPIPPCARRSTRCRPGAVGEDPGIEDRVAGFAGNRRMRSIQRNEAGGVAGSNAGRPATKRLVAAGKRSVEQRAAVRAAGRRQHIALAVEKALRIFELPQARPACRSAHSNPNRCRNCPPCVNELAGRESAVAEIGFRDRAETGDRARLSPSCEVSASVMWVAWMRHHAASTAALASSHSTGRAPDQATQSSTSRVCSATWIWIGPVPASSRRRPQVRPASPRAGCAARRRQRHPSRPAAAAELSIKRGERTNRYR